MKYLEAKMNRAVIEDKMLRGGIEDKSGGAGEPVRSARRPRGRKPKVEPRVDDEQPEEPENIEP